MFTKNLLVTEMLNCEVEQGVFGIGVAAISVQGSIASVMIVSIH